MDPDTVRIYCTKPTKYLFDQVCAQLQLENHRDFTQPDAIKELCEQFLKARNLPISLPKTSEIPV